MRRLMAMHEGMMQKMKRPATRGGAGFRGLSRATGEC
jgi:hypothetical protein